MSDRFWYQNFTAPNITESGTCYGPVCSQPEYPETCVNVPRHGIESSASGFVHYFEIACWGAAPASRSVVEAHARRTFAAAGLPEPSLEGSRMRRGPDTYGCAPDPFQDDDQVVVLH